jgi:hypothetical protein
MKPDHWRKVDELFEAALEHEPARRAAFLSIAGYLGALLVRIAGAHLSALLPAPAHLHPITSDLSAWYAGDFVLVLIISLALVGFAFYTSLAGQPLFRGALPDD